VAIWKAISGGPCTVPSRHNNLIRPSHLPHAHDYPFPTPENKALHPHQDTTVNAMSKRLSAVALRRISRKDQKYPQRGTKSLSWVCKVWAYRDRSREQEKYCRARIYTPYSKQMFFIKLSKRLGI